MKVFISALLALILTAPPVLAAPAPQKGESLPDFTLPAPKDKPEKDYLGISSSKPFRVQQIKADLVIIQIFSMYCPHCQKEAPNVNTLFRKIETNPVLKGKVKLMGIGAGNSELEVSTFKKRYHIPFPLFPDKDYTVHELLGSVRTPFFFAVKINRDGTSTVVHTQLGGIEDPDAYLKMVSQAAGIK